LANDENQAQKGDRGVRSPGGTVEIIAAAGIRRACASMKKPLAT
jgi:hypothetical protein